MKNYSDEEFFNTPFLGVTSVINTIFGNKYENSNIPDYILKVAVERGKAVHKYIENWLSWYSGKLDKIEEPHLDLEYRIYENIWKKWLIEEIELDIDPIYIEQKIINKKFRIKGIIDCIAIIDDKYCIIDWKTSSNLDEWYTNCQLQLYYMMLLKGNKEERKLAKEIKALRCLSLTKNGYRWIEFPIDIKLSNAILELWNKHFVKEYKADKKHMS